MRDAAIIMDNTSNMKNRTLNNVLWIVGCRIVQAVLGLVVTMVSARYLGPSNYGLINYAASITTFAIPIMQLGLNSTLVQELVSEPEKEGQTLGTAMVLSLLSACASIVGIGIFVSVANCGERITQIVCILYSLRLIAQALEMIQYWFQAKLWSKYTSLSVLFAYVVISVYKIVLLVTGQNIYYFAVAQSIDYLMIAISLMFLYRKLGGRPLRVSVARGKAMLQKSKYYIVSGIMVTIFAQTDKIMLNLMLGNEVTGFYAAAVACTTMTNFVFVAIVDSARPTILQSKKHDQSVYEKNVSLLYAVVFYLSLAQCVVVTAFSPLIIQILYGAEYEQSVGILRLAVWYTTFSYLGSARTVWILAEEKHKILWRTNLYGAIGNVLLNFALIPLFGAIGAAVASLLTQFITNVVLGYVIKEIRENNKLMLRGVNPRFFILEMKKKIANRSKK